MNQEQGMPDQTPGTENENGQGFNPLEGETQDDYYEVDNPKKEVISTIGDGEMHNEGLVGEGEIEDESFTAGTNADPEDVD